VLNADGYKIAVSGGKDFSSEYVAEKKVGDNTRYALPDLSPGDYTIVITPYSNAPEKFISRDTATINVSYYVQLALPKAAITEDGAQIAVSIDKVDYAEKFRLTINGKDYDVTAQDGKTSYDITSIVKEGGVGTYNISIVALPKDGSNYQQSEPSLIYYISNVTATIDTVTVNVTDSGVSATIRGAGAYYYLVEWQKNGITVAKDNVRVIDNADVIAKTTLKASEVDKVKVTPLVKGYYVAGDVVYAQVEAPAVASSGTDGSQGN
jgi:hypothetical protein